MTAREPIGRVVHVTTLASQSGAYGGPFDSARYWALIQHRSQPGDGRLVAGHLRGDRPADAQLDSVGVIVAVRRWLPVRGFIGLFSAGMARALVSEIRRAGTVHIAFGREFIPLAAALVGLAAGKVVVLQPHGMLTSRRSLAHRVLDLAVKRLVSRCDGVLALTEDEAGQLQEWGGRLLPPVRVLANPLLVDAPVHRDATPGHVRSDVLFLARLHPRKRVCDYIAAADRSYREHRPHKFSVVGPDSGDLSLVRKYEQLLPNLVYEGPVAPNEVARRVRESRVFVLCSESEPWGHVLVTALANGLPVVVVKSAVLAARIEEFGAGSVVDDRDPIGMANAIDRFLGSEQLYSEASAGARALAATLVLDLDDLANAYQAFSLHP